MPNQNNPNSHCPLTDMPDDNALLIQLKSAIEIAKKQNNSLTLILIDLDHPDKFNSQNDKLISQLSILLRNNTRSTDFISRCSAADFAILLPGTNLNKAYLVTQQLLNIIESEAVIIENKEIKVTASAGIAELSAGMDENDLFKVAIATLRNAKNSAKNRATSFLSH